MRHIVGSHSGSKLSRIAVIAIVDDDYSVREALTSLVRSLGYTAMAFECADDLLKANRRRVSCMIADVQMPGMTGLELYNRLVASGEPIPPSSLLHFRMKGRGIMRCKPA